MPGPRPRPVPKPPRAPRKHLTEAEFKALYQEARARGPFAQTVIATVYDCGLRAVEVGWLTLEHLQQLHGAERKIYVTRAKGSRSDWWSVNPVTRDLLLKWVTSAYPDKAARRAALPVFANRVWKGRGTDRGGISRHAVYYLVHDLGTCAGLDDRLAHPHSIRHARVQHLMEEEDRRARSKGLSFPYEVLFPLLAKILGHANARTTLLHYLSSTRGMTEFVDKVTSAMLGED